MANHVLCHLCNVVMVPAGTICITCAEPDPQRRQDYVERLKQDVNAARKSLRDGFAMAALSVDDSSGPEEQAASAYDVADAMLAEREGGPYSGA